MWHGNRRVQMQFSYWFIQCICSNRGRGSRSKFRISVDGFRLGAAPTAIAGTSRPVVSPTTVISSEFSVFVFVFFFFLYRLPHKTINENIPCSTMMKFSCAEGTRPIADEKPIIDYSLECTAAAARVRAICSWPRPRLRFVGSKKKYF